MTTIMTSPVLVSSSSTAQLSSTSRRASWFRKTISMSSEIELASPSPPLQRLALKRSVQFEDTSTVNWARPLRREQDVAGGAGEFKHR